MVAFTPNRGYPYSQSTDNVRIPQDIQRLAEAIDVDMQALDESIVPRPMAQVSSRSSTKQVFPPDEVVECTFDFVDVDTAGISNLGQFPTRLTPTSAGLWLAVGSVQVPTTLARSHDLFIRAGGVDAGRSTIHVEPIGLATFQMTIGAIFFMDGIDDFFTMTFEADASVNDHKIGNKRFTCWRINS